MKLNCSTIEYTKHSLMRIFERDISFTLIENAVSKGEIIKEYINDKPHKSYLLLYFYSEEPFHLLFAYTEIDNICILITIYKPDPEIWETNYKTKRGIL